MCLFYFLSFGLFLKSQLCHLKEAGEEGNSGKAFVKWALEGSWRVGSCFVGVSLLFKMALTVPILVGGYALTFEPGRPAGKID